LHTVCTISSVSATAETRSYRLAYKGSTLHIKILPNHYFALHIPDQLRWWGPLVGLSEFPGERLIGVLQNFKTNVSGLQLCDNFSKTLDGKVLSLYAKLESSFVCKDGKNVTRKNTNNIVEYILDGKKVYGEVVDIMKVGWGDIQTGAVQSGSTPRGGARCDG
ncbi:hypothetical protein VP01_3753g2, partial [Puccinia sorghi]